MGMMSADPRGAAAAEYLRRQSGAEGVELRAFERLTGGAIQDNFGLEISFSGGSHPGPQALVLRTDAPSGVAASLGRIEEFKVLQAAHEAGVTVPEPLWACADPGVIGAPFYIMRRAQGSASARDLVRGDLSAEQREALVQRLGEELGRLHRIGPTRSGLEFLGPAPADPALARVGLYRNWLDALPRPRPVLEWALAWLQRQAPTPAAAVLCHCDCRTGNFMAEKGTLTAVLDWEFAAWSDPCEDLGWLCARCWRFGGWAQEAGGIGSRQALYAGYEQVSGQPVDDLRVRYWEVMAAVRWAIIALQQGERHLSGEQPSLELALTARMVPEMELDLLLQIPQLEQGDGFRQT